MLKLAFAKTSHDRDFAIPTARHLQRAEAQLGIHLPPSYRDFARQFGYGRTCGMFVIYVPLSPAHPDDVLVRSGELSQMLAASHEEQLMEFAPDGSPDMLPSLVPFGIGENGETLAWDKTDLAPSREMTIYIIGSKTLAVTKVGRTIEDLVHAVCSERVKQLLGQTMPPLSRTFEPF